MKHLTDATDLPRMTILDDTFSKSHYIERNSPSHQAPESPNAQLGKNPWTIAILAVTRLPYEPWSKSERGQKSTGKPERPFTHHTWNNRRKCYLRLPTAIGPALNPFKSKQIDSTPNSKAEKITDSSQYVAPPDSALFILDWSHSHPTHMYPYLIHGITDHYQIAKIIKN